MDKDAEKKSLEDAKEVITAFQNHAISQEFAREEEERENGLLSTVCDTPIVDATTFFLHFQAIGELQGIRRRRAMLPGKLEEIQDRMKEL